MTYYIHSIRVYFLWTLDWTLDSINNWLYPPDIKMVTSYMNGHLNLLLTGLLLSIYICLLFLSFFSIYFLYLLTCYMHVHISFYPYTFTRSSDSLDLHIQICGYLLLIRYLERITGILRSWSSIAWSSFFGILLLFFISITSIILCVRLSTCFILLFIWDYV